MIDKRPIRPELLRHVPNGFSWVDHRLIRQRRLEGCPHSAWALYLFLVTVGDAQGLSYYSEASLCRRLRMDAGELATARRQLEAAGLIAYAKPLYQVLALHDPGTGPVGPEVPRTGQTMAAGELLRRMLEGGQQ